MAGWLGHYVRSFLVIRVGLGVGLVVGLLLEAERPAFDWRRWVGLAVREHGLSRNVGRLRVE